MNEGLQRHNQVFSYIDATFLAGTILIVPLVLSVSALDPGLMPRLTIVNALLLGYWMAAFLLKRIIVWLPVAAVLLLLYLSAVLVSVSDAVNKVESFLELYKSAAVIIYGFTAISILRQSPGLILFTIHTITLNSLTISAIGLVQFFGFIDFPRGWGWPTATLLNRNLFASYLIVSLGMCYCSFLIGNVRFRVVAAVAIVCGTAAAVIAESRAVWVAGAFGAGVLTLITIIKIKKVMPPRRRPRSIALIAMVVVGLLGGLMVYSLDDSRQTVVERAKTIVQRDFASNRQRLHLWKKTVAMIRDHPFTGVGAGNWKIMLPLYGTEDLLYDGNHVEVRPYNDFLWMGAECGVIRLFAYVAMFVWGIVHAIKILRQQPSGRYYAIATCLLFSIAAFFIVSCFDFPHERVEHSVLIFTIIAIAASLAGKKNERRISSAFANVTIMCIVFLLVIAGSIRWVQEKKVVRAYHARTSGDWASLLEITRSIDRRFLTMDYAATPIDWYEATALCGLGRIEAAKVVLTKALQSHPQHALSMHDLGSCHALSGHPAEAISCYNKALQLSPHFYEARKDKISVLYSMKKYREALGEIDRFCRNDSSFNRYRRSIREKLQKNEGLAE
ncbi:MAG: O-antigen ligase family protein [Chitinispirillaceae bacterium]|nr:O-antigen ligase family protein [Chitinispirillaceae bacterium]